MYVIQYYIDGEEHFQVYQQQSRMMRFIKDLDKNDIPWRWIK